MQVIEHTVCAHDDDADKTKLQVKLESNRIEINVLDDVGKEVSGAEVDDGYSRTVRLEMRKGELKILVYPAQTDEPTTYALNLNDFSVREED